MAKEILFDRELRERMMRGVQKLAGAVKITLGPRGRNVVMYQPLNQRDINGEADPSAAHKPGTKPYATNDGVTIARSIAFSDPFENMGVEILKEIAIKTNSEAGDGTTTAVILAEALLTEGMKNVVAGAHPIALKKGMAGAASKAIDAVKSFAVPIRTKEEISQVAAISCQDKKIGEMIGEAFDRVGLEGVVSVDTMSRSGKTELDIQEGIIFERGYLNELMVTNKESGTAELYNPCILITDYKIERPNDIIDIMIAAAEQDRPLLIIAESIETEAMGLILRNKLENVMDVVGINPPSYGEGRRWRLEDLAIQTGGRFISKEAGDLLKDVKKEDLGKASFVKVSKNQTVITGGGGDSAEIDFRIRQIRKLIETTDYEFNKERYKERLAKFVSGVATIQAGGNSELEINELKFRIEDAINAARSAMEEGIVPGGGTVLIDAIPQVKEFAETLEGDEKTGAEIVIKALEIPCKQIALNAGLNAESIVSEIKKAGPGTGFDAYDLVFVDMMDRGIVDPVKVTRLALESAVSATGVVLTSSAGLADINNI